METIMEGFQLPKGRGQNRINGLADFSRALLKISRVVGFPISSRGWGYTLEGFNMIDKSEIDRVQSLVNECRKWGLLPLNFVAEEEARQFSGVEYPDTQTPQNYMKGYLEAVRNCANWFTPDWWDGEEYYIQMLVEKIDLKTLFTPVCREYHIPIATSKGWSSMLQRGNYARRFKRAEEKGLKCVLLYCGDFDPDGLRISDKIKKNLYDLQYIRWKDGSRGYDPTNLIIDRFGLNYDFIVDNGLTWIDNLITGSKRNLANPSHPNHNLPYVQDYLFKVGERKCEANALVVRPDEGRELCRSAIEFYVGQDALDRFYDKRRIVLSEFKEFRDETGLDDAIQEAIDLIEAEED